MHSAQSALSEKINHLFHEKIDDSKIFDFNGHFNFEKLT